MIKVLCRFLITLFLFNFLFGCGFNHFTISTPYQFTSKQGKVNVSFNPLSPESIYFEGNSYIDFKSLDYENYNYYYFYVTISDSLKAPIKYELLIDSIYVSFLDTTQGYAFQWIKNDTENRIVGSSRDYYVELAPINIPKKYKKDFNISFIVNITNAENDELIEQVKIKTSNSEFDKFYSVFELPCYTVDFNQFKKTDIKEGDFGFTINDPHFYEQSYYYQDYQQEDKIDTNNYYYNFNATFIENNNSNQNVQFTIESIYTKNSKYMKPTYLNWTPNKLKTVYNQYYISASSIIIPKSNVEDIFVELSFKLLEPNTNKTITDKLITVKLKQNSSWYNLDNVKIQTK